ncbi:hypothetical protein MMC20_004451 [Loxospora ochrophaea]|nr:hypothetical protein [Loxospora ochrophaea]
MEGTDANGRRVSLLNDEPTSPSSAGSSSTPHSRQSSSASSVSQDDRYYPHDTRSLIVNLGGPASPVPRLTRFDSSSTQVSLATPSPMALEFPHDKPDDALDGASRMNSFFQFANEHMYPAMPEAHDSSTQPYYLPSRQANDQSIPSAYPSIMRRPAIQTQPSYAYASVEAVQPLSPRSTLQNPTVDTATNMVGVERTSPAAKSSTNASKSTKKKYPCPYRERDGCTDTFTTSGHAARHGKKHTGEKNILCPTCHKAFTRKDNMKQHERTHKNGQSSNSSTSTVSRASGVTQEAMEEAREAHSISRRRQKLSRSRSRSTTAPPSPLPNPGDIDPDVQRIKAEDQAARKRDITVRSTRKLPYSTESIGLTLDTTLAGPSRPSVERRFSGESRDGEGESPGLDALATAATRPGI